MVSTLVALGLAALGAAQSPLFLLKTYDDHHKETLWRSDGTAGGTKVLGRYCAVEVGPKVGGAAYFVTSDCRADTRLWRTNGTPQGTVVLRTILPEQLLWLAFGSFQQSVVLYATTQSSPRRFWTSDSTVGRTVPIPLKGLGSESDVCGMAEWKGALWFWVFDHSADQPNLRLWKSDGSSAGTRQVAGFPPEQDRFTGGECQLVPFRDHMYFVSRHDDLPSQLWRTDGTLAGTTLVRDFGEAALQGLTVSEDVLYFRKLDRSGDEWWRADGTTGHVRLIKRIPSFWYDQGDTSTTLARGVLYFTTLRRQLWKSDGTEAGTKLVKDFGNGSNDDYGDLEVLGEHGGTVYLMLGAPTSHSAKSLWKTDGTEKGTVFIKRVGEPVSWGKKKRK